MVTPAFDVVKPGKKSAVEDSKAFEICLNDNDFIFPSSFRFVKDNKNRDSILFADNVLSKSECESFRRCMDSCKQLTFWNSSANGSIDGDSSHYEKARMFRDADTAEVASRFIASAIWNRVKQACIEGTDNILIDFLRAGFIENDDQERDLVGLWIPDNLNHDLLFARYPGNGCFAPHTDGRTTHDFNTRSFFSVIIYLADIPLASGGGTRFYVDDAIASLQCLDGMHWTADSSMAFAEVESVAGRMLIFHQDLVHEGVPTTPDASSNKYIIRSDVMFKRTPALCDSPQDIAAFDLFQQAENAAEEGDVAGSIALFRRALKLSPEMARLMGHS